MKIEFKLATGDCNSRIHVVVVDDCVFGVLVIRKHPDFKNKCVWSVFNGDGIMVEGGYGEEYDSFSVKEEIKTTLSETLKGEYGYE